MSDRFVSYLRVSTDGQGKSGLGLEDQQAAISAYLKGRKLLAEYVEVESGKVDNRPQLRRALHHAKITGSTLLVAKLDRLSRDVAFIAATMKTGVPFVTVDSPITSTFERHIRAAVAEEERRMISARTKGALNTIKERIAAKGSYISKAGRTITRLGNPAGAAQFGKRGSKRGSVEGVKAIKTQADRTALELRPVVEDIQASGVVTVPEIAEELNRRGILSPRGAGWHTATVVRLLRRLATLD